jgi:Arc/MetJ-type ribon-helix-helix transcriptional regulator
MSGHSKMVSLRIPEDHALELEQRVGFDGMRNRSDVIRTAVRDYLKQPQSPDVGAEIEVHLGLDLADKFNQFCKLRQDKPDDIMRVALRNHMKNEMEEGVLLDQLLQKRMDELRAKQSAREDHTP